MAKSGDFDNPVILAKNKISKEGFSNKFVDSYVDKLDIECAFCVMVMRDARQISSCGHSFCATCWSDWLSSHKSVEQVHCPIDNLAVDVSLVFEDRKQDRLIGGLAVYCDNLDYGCKDTPELRYLEEHLEKCQYQTVSCERQCGMKVLLGDLADHMLLECPRRMVTCELCEAAMSAIFIQGHADICPVKQVSCQFCFMQGIPRSELSHHQHTSCPKFPTLCSFALAGCVEKIERDSLIDHHTAEFQKHLRLLNTSQLYHTTGVAGSTGVTGSENSLYELPSALWGRVCEDGTDVPWDELPGCEVGEGGCAVGLYEKVKLLEGANEKLTYENGRLMAAIGHIQKKEEEMENEIHELKENKNHFTAGMEKMEKDIEELKGNNGKINNKVENGALCGPKELVKGQHNVCPCFWTVKIEPNSKIKHSPPFYTRDGYKMVFYAHGVAVGAFLHKADGDHSRKWPWNGQECIIVSEADNGQEIVKLESENVGKFRRDSDRYRQLGEYLFYKLMYNLVDKTVKLTMR